MRVKIGNTWYEAKPGQPIMVEFTQSDKTNIKQMLPETMKYASFDNAEEMTRQQMLDWVHDRVQESSDN